MFRRLGKLFDWLVQHELAVLLAVLDIVLGVWGFANLTDKASKGRTQAFGP